MSTEIVKLETVQYNTIEIARATAALIRNFAVYSGIFGTEQWIQSLFHLMKIINEEKPQPYSLTAEGIGIEFSGFPKPIPQTQYDGEVVFRSLELSFTIRDKAAEVLPSARNRIEKVTPQITKEMQDVFKLRVDRNPYRLSFPKEQYARSIKVSNARLIK